MLIILTDNVTLIAPKDLDGQKIKELRDVLLTDPRFNSYFGKVIPEKGDVYVVNCEAKNFSSEKGLLIAVDIKDVRSARQEDGIYISGKREGSSVLAKADTVQTREPAVRGLPIQSIGQANIEYKPGTKFNRSDRKVSDMADVLADPKAREVARDNNQVAYYMDRGLKEKDGLRYDVTFMLPGQVTLGHYHVDGGSELYEVIDGEGFFFLQKVNELGEVVDVMVMGREVDAHGQLQPFRAGDKVNVVPGYGHVWVNVGDAPLVLGNWANVKSTNDYTTWEQTGGHAVGLSWDKKTKTLTHHLSDQIKSNPSVRYFIPASMPALGLIPEPTSMITWIKDHPEQLESLKNPQKFTTQFASAYKEITSNEGILLVENVRKLSRIEGGIVAGVGLPDIHGRVFNPNGQFFKDDGSYAEDLQKFMKSLSDKSTQDMIHAGIMYYDIRSKFWKDNLAFTVAFAFAFAKKLQEIEGRQDGIVLHIGVDAYHKHFETAQVFADAILRTKICDNGGGIYYWGVINGGGMRGYGQLYHAMNNRKGGNWVYFTMSHVRDDFLGGKLARGAKVYCGPEIRHCESVTSGTLYDAIVEKDFASIKHNAPIGNVVTVSSVIKNNIEVAADMIRATSASADVLTNKLLKSEKTKFYVLMGGSPMAKNLVDMLRALGADVEVEDESVDKNFNTDNIIDPSELNNPEAHPLQVAMNKRLKDIAKKTERTVLVIDPDGDRGSFIAIDKDGNAIALSGSKLLLLAMENLARSYKDKGLPPPTVISDMRTGLSAKDFAKVLNERGFPINVVPFEAGYPFFMRGIADLRASLAVENTTHAFTNPMTNPNWGAKKSYPGYQGGDDAALFLTYLAGCMVNQWEGKNPVEQLQWIIKKYGLKPTVDDERKPMMQVKDDKHKYTIAERMKKLTKQYCADKNRFLINFDDPKVKVVSGVHLTNVKTGAMVLVRFSNTGATFTISGEGYIRKELNEMLGLGYWIMKTAVDQLHAEGNVFDFDPKDAAKLSDEPIFDEMDKVFAAEGQPLVKESVAARRSL